MISERNLDLLDRFAWILIYGGLILVVLGLATASASAVVAWSLAVPGCVAAIGGVVLIAMRPGLEAPDGGAQSHDPSDQGKP